ncbi:MAG: beta-propeller fold lactonase family protein [Pseudomonadota bacterium]
MKWANIADKPLRRSIALTALILLLVSGGTLARLSEPDHVFYGNATWFGDPLAAGSLVTLRLDGQPNVIASYTMGTDEQLGGLYALRVPMDSLDPRLPGRARPGEGASIYINDSIVANVNVGDYGETQRVDIDPAFLTGSTPAIVVAAAQGPEGDAGTSMLVFQANLTIPSENPVSFNWTTGNGTAVGGAACSSDVDYLNDSSIADFPAGTTATTFAVTVCGDTLVEDNETFSVTLSNPLNAILQFPMATGTIQNDDGQPQIRVSDTVVWEPVSGSTPAQFEILLSRAYTQDVQVTYQAVSDTATVSQDFTAANGTATIAAGDMSAVVQVSVSADALTETPEAFVLMLSNPVNASLADGDGMAIILDADTVPENQLADTARNGVNGVEGLAGPTDVVFSSDGRFLYVSTVGSQSVVIFEVSDLGRLTFIGKVDAATAGFETGFFSGLQSLAMTPDSLNLYAAASGNNGVTIFRRNAVTGELMLMGTVANGDESGGTPITGLGGAWDLVVSEDGSQLYVAGSSDDSVAVFDVDTDTGMLTWLETETTGENDPDDAGPAVNFVDRPVSLRVTPDGSRVVVGSDFSSAFSVFNRAADGKLSFVDTFRDNVSGIDGLGAASAVAVAPNSADVYVAGRSDDTLAQFALSGSSASFVSALDRSLDRFAGLDGPDALTLAPDGSALYAVGFEDSSFVMFNRRANGELTFAEIYIDDTPGMPFLAGPTAVAVRRSGGVVAVAASVDNAINIFTGQSTAQIFADGFEN